MVELKVFYIRFFATGHAGKPPPEAVSVRFEFILFLRKENLLLFFIETLRLTSDLKVTLKPAGHEM